MQAATLPPVLGHPPPVPPHAQAAGGGGAARNGKVVDGFLSGISVLGAIELD